MTDPACMGGARITRITFSTTASRASPKQGDRRTTKRHGDQVRVWELAHCGAFIVRNGSPRYIWVGIDELAARGCGYLLTADDKARIAGKQP